MTTKITAIRGGGDWTDASVDFVILPEGSDLKALKKEYDLWYKFVYLENYKVNYDSSQYLTFGQWLLKHGARIPLDTELEDVDEESLRERG